MKTNNNRNIYCRKNFEALLLFWGGDGYKYFRDIFARRSAIDIQEINRVCDLLRIFDCDEVKETNKKDYDAVIVDAGQVFTREFMFNMFHTHSTDVDSDNCYIAKIYKPTNDFIKERWMSFQMYDNLEEALNHKYNDGDVAGMDDDESQLFVFNLPEGARYVDAEYFADFNEVIVCSTDYLTGINLFELPNLADCMSL